MREIKTHRAGSGLDEQIAIHVMDEPGPGGACHLYHLVGDTTPTFVGEIKFQKGPMKEAGVNGISIESLLAICIDRLEGFQAGPYPDKANAEAIFYLHKALGWLHTRTITREANGVEGTSAPTTDRRLL